MGVLEDAQRVVFGDYAKVLLHLRVPRLREVGDGEVTFEETHLQLEAEQDVEVVGKLVGLRPDLRRPHGVDGPVHGLDVYPVENTGEGFPQLRLEV